MDRRGKTRARTHPQHATQSHGQSLLRSRTRLHRRPLLQTRPIFNHRRNLRTHPLRRLRPHLPATLAGMAERTIVVNAITKTANASGWRVGWVISPEQHTPQDSRCSRHPRRTGPHPIAKRRRAPVAVARRHLQKYSQTILAKTQPAPQRTPIHRIQNHPTRRLLLPLCRLPLCPHLMRHESQPMPPCT